jgi:hypothetical protein
MSSLGKSVKSSSAIIIRLLCVMPTRVLWIRRDPDPRQLAQQVATGCLIAASNPIAHSSLCPEKGAMYKGSTKPADTTAKLLSIATTPTSEWNKN